MSPAPHPPGRSPPDSVPLRFHARGRSSCRRALARTIPSSAAPGFIESGPLNDTLLRSHRHTGRVVRYQEVAVRGLADAWGASAVRAPR
jgi:hypothetical protein